MSCIVKQKRKGTDTVYVYRSESVWVPGVGPRSKRTLIGKLDPVSGEVVPTGKRGRKKKEPEQPAPGQAVGSEAAAPDATGDDLQRTKQALIDTVAESQEMEQTLDALERENALPREELAQMKAQMARMAQCLRDLESAVVGSLDRCLEVVRAENTEDER